jgi:AraC-like DNA-binding protein
MWSSKVVETNDPDEFVSLIRPSGCKLLVTGRGEFRGRSTLIDLGGIYAQRGSERLARVATVEMTRSGILFHTKPGPSMYWDGAEIRTDQVAIVRAGCGYVSRLAGPTSWGAMTLSGADMEAFCASSSGARAALLSGCAVVTPPAAALARLRLLHASAEHLGETSESYAVWLEQALIETMRELAGFDGGRTDSMARQHHQMIIRRFMEVLDSQPAGTNYMQDISDAIGVSSRTLRMACRTQLGVSPTQYLLLRRMGLARRALRQAEPGVTRVTDVATEFGFLELGRFAVKYRQIFGETPSSTLRAACPPAAGRAAASYAFA